MVSQGGSRRGQRLRVLVPDMAGSKITITLPEDQIKRIRALVEAGEVGSVCTELRQ